MNWDSSAEPDLDQGHMRKVLGNSENMREAPAPTFWVRAEVRVTEDTRDEGRWLTSRELTFVWSIDIHSSDGSEFLATCSAEPKIHLRKLDRLISLKDFFMHLFIRF